MMRPHRWSARRHAAIAGGIIGALVLLSLVWPTLDAYARATALVGEAVLRLPVSPLGWVTPDPVAEELHWPNGGYGVLTRPGGGGRHPAFVLMLGAEPAEPDDPRVRRLTGGLARIGFGTLLVRSEALIDGRVLPDEPPLLVGAFEALRSHPRVRPDRVAFVGLSVGGSVQLVAAADPAIAGEVWFVLALGPYFDARTLAATVLSRQYRTPQGTVTWDPDDTATKVVTRTLLAILPAAEADALREGRAPQSADGRLAQELLAGPALERAEAIMGELSPSARAPLDAISPRGQLAGVRAPLYLLHDRNDPFIPWTESDAIAATYRPAVYHRLEIFEHVDPDPANLGVLLRDGWRLLRLFASIIRDGRG